MKSAVTLSLVPEAAGGPFVFWHDAESAIRAALDLGFEAMEVFAPDAATVRNLQWSRIAPTLPVAALGTGAGWVKHRLLLSDQEESNRKAAIEFVTEFLAAGAELNAKVIIGSMQGRSNANHSRLECLKRLKDSLHQLDREASKYGTQLLFEPLNRYETDLVNTIDDAAKLLDGLSHTLILGDLFHMNIEERFIEDSIRQHGDWIGHVHFADTNRQAVGFGHLTVHKIVEALKDINYTGFLSAEVLAKPDSFEAARQTIDSFRKYCLQ